MIEWFGQTLTELPAIYERVIPPPGRGLSAYIDHVTLGTRIVHVEPGNTPREKPALGLDVREIEPPHTTRHWAIIGAEPAAILASYVRGQAPDGLIVHIRTIGSKPAQHWIVNLSPIPSGQTKVTP